MEEVVSQHTRGAHLTLLTALLPQAAVAEVTTSIMEAAHVEAQEAIAAAVVPLPATIVKV